MRFHPHTYVRTQQSLPLLWAAIKTKLFWTYNPWNEYLICPMICNIFGICILVRYIITCTLNDGSIRGIVKKCRDNVMMVLFYFSSCNLNQKFVAKFTKLRKIGFSMECFTHRFSAIFYQKKSKFGFWVTHWVLAIKPKYFRDFLEIS